MSLSLVLLSERQAWILTRRLAPASLHANRSLASFVLPLSHLQVDVDSPPNSILLFIQGVSFLSVFLFFSFNQSFLSLYVFQSPNNDRVQVPVDPADRVAPNHRALEK